MTAAAGRGDRDGAVNDADPQPGTPTDDYRCCARDEGHDGPCEWLCGDCGGTGRCPECEADCVCDDVVQCEWCDGNHACPASCYEGRIVEDWP